MQRGFELYGCLLFIYLFIVVVAVVVVRPYYYYQSHGVERIYSLPSKKQKLSELNLLNAVILPHDRPRPIHRTAFTDSRLLNGFLFSFFLQ